MKLSRFEIEIFAISMAEAVEISRKLLERHPEYRKNKQLERDSFVCFVNPKWLSNSNKMKIRLYEHPDGVVVRVAMSQPRTSGNAACYLDRFIRQFMARFREQVLLDDGT